jgi:hypothetical protein
MTPSPLPLVRHSAVLPKYIIIIYIFSVIPLYFQYVLVHSANCVKTCIQWHAEECSLALLCN